MKTLTLSIAVFALSAAAVTSAFADGSTSGTATYRPAPTSTPSTPPLTDAERYLLIRG